MFGDRVPNREERLSPGSHARIASAIATTLGALWILAVLGVNEWTIAWFVGVPSLFPGSRIVVGLFDLFALSWGVVSVIWSSRAWVLNLNLSVLTSLALLGLFEASLHVYPQMLGHTFANGVFSKYNTSATGIYYRDYALKMNFMVPNFKTQMYYYGYTWEHQTDEFGFRTVPGRVRTDVAILGDSFVYGHGMQFSNTVAARLEQYTGMTVSNLGRQGDSAWQEAFLLTEHIDRVRPRYVVYVYFQNDIRDLYDYLTDDELNGFLAAPVTELRFPKRGELSVLLTERSRRNNDEEKSRSLSELLRRRVLLSRVPDLVGFAKKEQALDSRIAKSGNDLNDEHSLGWRVEKHFVRYMHWLSREHNAAFLIVPIVPDAPRHFEILRRLAADEGIPFVDTSSMARSKEELWLPRDMHLSEAGAKLLAQLIGDSLFQKP